MADFDFRLPGQKLPEIKGPVPGFSATTDCDMVGFCSEIEREGLSSPCYKGGHLPHRCTPRDKIQIRLLAAILKKLDR